MAEAPVLLPPPTSSKAEEQTEERPATAIDAAAAGAGASAARSLNEQKEQKETADQDLTEEQKKVEVDLQDDDVDGDEDDSTPDNALECSIGKLAGAEEEKAEEPGQALSHSTRWRNTRRVLREVKYVRLDDESYHTKVTVDGCKTPRTRNNAGVALGNVTDFEQGLKRIYRMGGSKMPQKTNSERAADYTALLGMATFNDKGLKDRIIQHAVPTQVTRAIDIAVHKRATRDFKPCPKMIKKPGQTFVQYVTKQRQFGCINKPGGTRNVLAIQVCGTVPPDEFKKDKSTRWLRPDNPDGQWFLNQLVSYMAAFFCGLEVQLVTDYYRGKTSLAERKKWIYEELPPVKAKLKNCYALLGVTTQSIGGIYGIANLGGTAKTGIFSIGAMGLPMSGAERAAKTDWKQMFVDHTPAESEEVETGDVDQLELARFIKFAFKTISHETLHTFGHQHCHYYECLMNDAYEFDVDEVPMEPCPVCLKKMLFSLEADPIARYVRLKLWADELIDSCPSGANARVVVMGDNKVVREQTDGQANPYYHVFGDLSEWYELRIQSVVGEIEGPAKGAAGGGNGGRKGEKASEQQQAQRTPGHCANGHPLVRHLTKHGGFYCDGCLAQVAQGSAMWGCRECNFDICETCFSSKEEAGQQQNNAAGGEGGSGGGGGSTKKVAKGGKEKENGTRRRTLRGRVGFSGGRS